MPPLFGTDLTSPFATPIFLTAEEYRNLSQECGTDVNNKNNEKKKMHHFHV